MSHNNEVKNPPLKNWFVSYNLAWLMRTANKELHHIEFGIVYVTIKNSNG